MCTSAQPQACEPLLKGGFPSMTDWDLCSLRARKLLLLCSVVLKCNKPYTGKDFDFNTLCEKVLVWQEMCKSCYSS